MSTYRARFDATVTLHQRWRAAGPGFPCRRSVRRRSDVGAGRRAVPRLTRAADGRRCGAGQSGDRRGRAQGHSGWAGRSEPGSAKRSAQYVELNHVIRDGMVTLPNLPGPRAREAVDAGGVAGSCYAAGHGVRDRPDHDGGEHRHLYGQPVSPLPRRPRPHRLHRSTAPADLPAVVVRLEDSGRLGIDAARLGDVRRTAAKRCCCTPGDDARFGTPQYVENAHFLTRDGAEWLIAQRCCPGRHRRSQHRRHDRRHPPRPHSAPRQPV